MGGFRDMKTGEATLTSCDKLNISQNRRLQYGESYLEFSEWKQHYP